MTLFFNGTFWLIIIDIFSALLYYTSNRVVIGFSAPETIRASLDRARSDYLEEVFVLRSGGMAITADVDVY